MVNMFSRQEIYNRKREEKDWRCRKPTIGIVVTTIGKVDDILNVWLPHVKRHHEHVELCIVESNTDKETSSHNRNLCLDNNVRRHWVPKHGKWGKAFARNYGAMKVSGEYLWFVDGDCFPFPYAIEYMLETVTPEAIVCGRITFPQPNDEPYWDDHREQLFKGAVTPTHYLWGVGEGNMCYPRTLFDSVGGFDVSWAVSGWCPEGVDLYWRIFCRHFTPLLLATEIVVEHQWHEPSEERIQAITTGENIEPLKRRLHDVARQYGVLDHPKVKEILLAAQGDLLDGR